jgi:2-oxoglutarate dehydrogenase E1 component
MSPKSLLRHKEAISTLEELANGRFHNVLDEIDELDRDKVERVILCSGKVFYDLLAARRERGIDNVAIIRMEQLYPFPEAELLATLAAYPNLVDAVWCQEEPMNQGAWYSSQHHMRRVIHRHKVDVYLRYVGRDSSAAPAAGYMALHLEQLQQFIDEALGPMPWGS